MSGYNSTTQPTNAQFRADFPEFTSTATYPDTVVTMWLTIANSMLSASATKWSTVFGLGCELFAAHNLVLEQKDYAISLRGGVPGINAGVVSSKGVGGASISYDTSSGVEANAGHWNLTIYGRRFMRLARMAGMGGAIIYQ